MGDTVGSHQTGHTLCLVGVPFDVVESPKMIFKFCGAYQTIRLSNEKNY